MRADLPLRAFRLSAGAAFLAVLSLPFRPAARLIGRPLTEDAFYVLSIARHMAAGQGITIDGSTPTNGFQPLYTFLVAALAWLAGGDRVTLMRLVLLLELLIHVAAAIVTGSVAARLVPDARVSVYIRWATVLGYLGLRLLVLQHFNGLETGLLLLLVSATWLIYLHTGARSRESGVALGLALGLTVLTRLDMVFLVAVLSFALWMPSRVAHHPLTVRLAVPAIPALMLLPWLAFSYSVSGTIIPTSGLAQQAWTLSAARLLSGLHALGQNGVPIYLGAFEGDAVSLGRAALLPGVVAVAVVCSRRLWRTGDDRARAALSFAAVLSLTLVTLAAWYCASSWATHFYSRYLAPLLLLSSVGLGVALGSVATRRPFFATFVAALIALQALAYAGALYADFYVGSRLSARVTWSRALFADQLALVVERVPPTDTVAAGQSGTLGFFRDRVVNVDGKVNRDALAHQDDMRRYLDSRDIRWFCDMPLYVTKYLGPDPSAAGWRLVASSGLFDLYVREPSHPQP